MRNVNKIAAGIALSVTPGTAGFAHAHPGAMGGGMGPGAQGAPQTGMQMKHGMHRGPRCGTAPQAAPADSGHAH